jgi:hypothetical protein
LDVDTLDVELAVVVDATALAVAIVNELELASDPQPAQASNTAVTVAPSASDALRRMPDPRPAAACRAALLTAQPKELAPSIERTSAASADAHPQKRSQRAPCLHD